LLAWDVGPRLAPYVRNLKLRRPVVAVLIDSRSARLFRSVNGKVAEIDTFSGHYRMNDVSKGTRKTASTTTGVRGETKSDSATRSLGAEIERMWTRVIDAVVDLAGRDSYVVFGGPAGHIGSFRASLHDELHHRSVEVPTLHVDSSPAELEDALQAAATDMTSRRQEAFLEDLIQEAGGGNHAALGPKATEVHLDHGAVSTLLLSRDFLVREPRDAERMVRLAIQTGAGIEEVGGDPGARLDREGGGVGAGLRFSVGGVGE
jgi:stalled ribosome rescue protein Dom34